MVLPFPPTSPFIGGFTVSVLLSLGACKDLKIHPACGDTPGTPCPSELGTAGVAGAGAGSGPPWPPLLQLTDGKVSCAVSKQRPLSLY